MKPPRQFLALFRYNAFASPWIWVFPFTFGLQPGLSLMSRATWYSLETFLAPLTIFGFLPMMIAAFVFAGERLFTGTPGLTTQTYQQIQTFAGEFLLTRAVDRPVVFRSRFTLYWTLILLPLLLVLGLTILRPEISLSVPLKSPEKAEWYLSQLPGATVTRTTETTKVISAPHGRVGLGVAIVLLGAACATVWPAFIYAILPLRWRKVIFWGLFAVLVFLPVGMIWISHGRGGTERTVLWIMNHGALCALAAVALAAASYFFCASRDREVEYP
jgi:hypothetical protein